MGNKKAQRITVGVIIGVIVLSLALTLLSTASATSSSRPRARRLNGSAPESALTSGDPVPRETPGPDSGRAATADFVPTRGGC